MSTICVHGLGYIGLPTAAMFANYGYEVVGYDVSEELVSRLNQGDVHIEEPGLRAFVTQALESGKLRIESEIVPSKYHLICVPTPFDTESQRADLSYVEAAASATTPHLRTGDTVILESTVPPGTTVGTVQPILEESGFEAGKDVALVHCPETVLTGDMITELKQNDRVIGGVNGVSTEAAVRLYETFLEGEIRTAANATTAEFVKLLQNTYRDTNIALANEVAKLARDYRIDSRAAIELANSHPRVDLHQPGPGVGGHCLPIDPWFLGQESDELDLVARARQINDEMPAYVVNLVDDHFESLAGRKIAILGIAYKGNVGDTRMSPGLQVAAQLRAIELTDEDSDGPAEPPRISLNDPHVTDQTRDLEDLETAIDGADAVVITCDHDEYAAIDPETLASRMRGSVVVDTKAIVDEDAYRESALTVVRL
ncbi:nucleotide sugar dehydrogenase [Halosolutus amylolyticus]|uniref:UDP-N-acetyl-D-mannosamine dehydrogenase n=1 Tax=Halosolutus amylolyticus TaxID=2932267 RepID=A0ABD5PQP0_9EURY|nr:nucleotide sugar dehydrogenase [Halosolutus amylolyticus]